MVKIYLQTLQRISLQYTRYNRISDFMKIETVRTNSILSVVCSGDRVYSLLHFRFVGHSS